MKKYYQCDVDSFLCNDYDGVICPEGTYADGIDFPDCSTFDALCHIGAASRLVGCDFGEACSFAEWTGFEDGCVLRVPALPITAYADYHTEVHGWPEWANIDNSLRAIQAAAYDKNKRYLISSMAAEGMCETAKDLCKDILSRNWYLSAVFTSREEVEAFMRPEDEEEAAEFSYADCLRDGWITEYVCNGCPSLYAAWQDGR